MVTGGYALNVAADSQAGFRSDFNNLYATGSGGVAFWQGIARPNLAVWRTTAFTDANSLSVDPKFVDVPGADGVLGYSTPTNDGRDDDFHLKSQYGSFHGIAFAPVVTGNGLGAPVMLTSPGNPVADATTSALIDRGDPADSFAAEPTPNGSYINIGAYGGTTQASISPAEYVTVTNPDGGEVWPKIKRSTSNGGRRRSLHQAQPCRSMELTTLSAWVTSEHVRRRGRLSSG